MLLWAVKRKYGQPSIARGVRGRREYAPVEETPISRKLYAYFMQSNGPALNFQKINLDNLIGDIFKYSAGGSVFEETGIR